MLDLILRLIQHDEEVQVRLVLLSGLHNIIEKMKPKEIYS